MQKIGQLIYPHRKRESSLQRPDLIEEFTSDHSRLVFCSSFRRMMQKAQVFSLEQNTSVRNRLTHSLEVADVGRTIARQVGHKLMAKKLASLEDVVCLETIVENACLMHDIGNPPFGHFGEKAIKRWFTDCAPQISDDSQNHLKLKKNDERLSEFRHFDGNPQGFRIVTKLHTEIDEHGLNLSYSTLLASLKYPNYGQLQENDLFSKKIGIFMSEVPIYKDICQATGHQCGKRYFIVYLMELADDICYCLSDIADAFEKKIIDSRMFKDELKKVFKEDETNWDLVKDIMPDNPIKSFSHDIAIKLSRKCVAEATKYFVDNLDSFIAGEAPEIIDVIPMDKVLKCLKTFSRKFIYTAPEAQKIEIAGHKIVSGLLDHYGILLKVSKDNFSHFINKKRMKKNSDLDIEWRIYNQLSKRMVQSYSYYLEKNVEDEWFTRCRLIVDYISGMSDQSALRFYQNAMGISLDYLE